MAKVKKPAKPKANGKHVADKKPKGCYVLSLTVENIRCFGPKQTLDCSDGNGRPRQWTILLGINGTGKTTLLKMIALHSIAGRSFDSSQSLLRGLEKTGRSTITTVIGHNYHDVNSAKGTSIVGRQGPFFPLPRPMSVEKWAGEEPHYDFQYGFEPVCYGSKRAASTSNESSPFTISPRIDSLFCDDALLNVERWLLNTDHKLKLNDVAFARKRYMHAKEMLCNILHDVNDIRIVPGRADSDPPSVEYLTSDGWVPYSRLGTGYQSVISWIMDYVVTLYYRHEDEIDPFTLPAVCLVDEIDLHLHPVWQRKVICYLSERFPNTQFIVTAHSPLVVQAAANADANIAVLVRSKEKDADGNYYVEIKNNPEDVKNWRLDQILTSDLFGGISLNPPEVEKLFKEKEHLINLKRLKPDQKARLAEIEEKIGKLPVGDDAREIKEMDAIREAIELLKKRPAK